MGVAIKDIEKCLSFYRDVLGLKATAGTREGEMGAAMAFVDIGESSFELMSPMEEPPAGTVGDIMRKFIDRNGEGIHHVALAVDNIEAALRELEQKGVALIDKTPRPGAHGRIAFLHPKATYGILIELCEPYHHH